MILHQDAIIALEYNPATDVLTVKWPEVSNHTLPELIDSFRKLVATIRHYDIKYLLVDARNHNGTEVQENEYQQAVFQLAQDFGTTRLQKIARIQADNLTVEIRAQKINAEVEKTIPAHLAFKNFAKQTEAINWLKEKD